jgi:hypothetical protein
MAQDNTWELSKENFVPRKEGRRVETLADPAALGSASKRVELEAQRRQLWQEVQEYNGDDPLEPWQRCAASPARPLAWRSIRSMHPAPAPGREEAPQLEGANPFGPILSPRARPARPSQAREVDAGELPGGPAEVRAAAGAGEVHLAAAAAWQVPRRREVPAALDPIRKAPIIARLDRP